MMKLFYSLILFFVCSIAVKAQVIYVDATATGANDGTSWANAYTELRTALQNQTNNVEIWVAQGTYKADPAFNRNSNFTISSNNVSLYGGFNGTEVNLSDRQLGTSTTTTLSGDLIGDDNNSFAYGESTRQDNSFNILSITGSNAIVDGFTFYGGHAAGGTQNGGAIRVNTANASFTVENCRFERNVTFVDGGAISVRQSTGTSSFTINKCVFIENMSRNGGAGFYAITGSAAADIDISNSVFYRNEVRDITNNPGRNGSSAYVFHDSNGNISFDWINNTSVRNLDVATLNNDSQRSTLSLRSTRAASLYDFNVANSLFWENLRQGGVATAAISSSVNGGLAPITTITNSTDQLNFANTTPPQGYPTVNSNNLDPLFRDIIGGDLTLIQGSPAINSGEPTFVRGNEDVEGNTRVEDGIVDRGAYENTIVAGGIYYVDQNASGNNDGTSWSDAFTDLQDALASAGPQAEIWIASGTYLPTNAVQRNVSFEIIQPDLKIYGGFAGTETAISQRVATTPPTILSGDLLGNDDGIITYFNTSRNDNSLRVVTITSNGTNALFDGVTINGGHSNAAGGVEGAGLAIDSSIADLSFVNCVFDYNISRNFGGALLLTYNGSAVSNYSFNRCQFNRNFSRSGGAIYAVKQGSGDYNLVVNNSLFRDNVTSDHGNVQGQSGSSIYSRSDASGLMNITNAHNTYVNNNDSSTGVTTGGRTTVVAIQQAGQMTYSETQSIFWENYDDAANTSLAFGISPMNTFAPSFNIQRSLEYNGFTNLNIHANTTLGAIVNSDPLFVDVQNDNFRLSAGSPAIDYGFFFSAIGNLDLDGNSRQINSNTDLGAYEFGSGTPPCVVNIPDAAFKADLLSDSSINTNGNSEIECSEASSFNGTLFLNDSTISDLTGIEFFTNIVELRSNNLMSNLTNIDLSSNTFLTTISLAGLGSLSSIDITQCAALNYIGLFGFSAGMNNNLLNSINLQGNPQLLEVFIQGFDMLNTIDFSNNPSVVDLDLRRNNITTLDLSSQSQLDYLNLSLNNLSTIDLSNNVQIQELLLIDNPLTTINTSSLTQLDSLNLFSCTLTTLDVSANPNLNFLDVRVNNLSSLNLANGNNAALGTFNANNNPNLTCIQIDANFTPPATGWNKDATASYSSNCTASIDEELTFEIELYPNPTEGELIISNNNDVIIDEIRIYNSQAQLVNSIKNSTTMDVSNLSSGTYYVQIIIQDAVVTKKLIKN